MSSLLFKKRLIYTNNKDVKTVAGFYSVNGRTLQYQYKNFLSNYKAWGQKSHASDWLLFNENIGEYLSIDETSLSHDELYTILTNKKAKGKKGSIVAIVQGTKADNIINILNKIPLKQRRKVKEVTLDMAGSMKLIRKRCFPNSVQVIERLHVQKLAIEALQELRVQYRWKAIDH
ncbi:ISL3 family transposase, partial [Flavobacterium sp. RHBU_3]|uniref:ISAon1 family transposase n=1 Tax=Flavobacterium sp. RHBU_3 TaxID=3391184 RepID=UPI003984742B